MSPLDTNNLYNRIYRKSIFNLPLLVIHNHANILSCRLLSSSQPSSPEYAPYVRRLFHLILQYYYIHKCILRKMLANDLYDCFVPYLQSIDKTNLLWFKCCCLYMYSACSVCESERDDESKRAYSKSRIRWILMFFLEKSSTRMAHGRIHHQN